MKIEAVGAECAGRFFRRLHKRVQESAPRLLSILKYIERGLYMEFGQGNTYCLPVRLTVNGAAPDIGDIEQVEFCFSGLRRVYGLDDTVRYDPDSGLFIIDLSQEDTFALAVSVNYQARVLFKDGTVRKTPVYTADVSYSISKAVLK